MAGHIQTITVPCDGAIKSDDVNTLFTRVPNLSTDERKLIQGARSSVCKEWACFMKHAEVIIRFDERNLQAKLQSGKRTNRLLVHYNHKGDVEQIWEEVGWIMWSRDVCAQAFDLVVKFAPHLLQFLQPAMKLMITSGEESKS